MQSKLIKFINEQLLKNNMTIDAEYELLLSGILDSLAVMNLVTYIEKLIGKPIPALDVTLENFSSVSAILRYLEAQGLTEDSDQTEKTDG